MTNMQAALAVAQLEKIDEHINRKREIGRLYDNLLSDFNDVLKPIPLTEYAENIYWVYGLVIGDSYDFDSIEASRRLKEMGIGTRTFFYPIHKQPVYLKQGMFHNVSCQNAEKLAERGLYIPSGLGITDDEIERVAKAVKIYSIENLLVY